MRIILTHEHADFDAIASLLGAHKLYPNAVPVLPHRINRNVQAFLSLYRTELPFVDPDTLPRGRHVRRVILVDTQSLVSVRGMGPELEQVLVIDHHAQGEDWPANWVFRGEELGAVTTLLVETMSARLMPFSSIEATLMLAGIYEDTGGLRFSSTTARDMRAAAWLLEHGASLEIANDFLQHSLTVTQRGIYEILLHNLETLELKGHAVVIAGARTPQGVDEELSPLAHKLRDLVDPSALLMVVEMGQCTHLIARSTTADISVAEVARHFGGGGHDRAAAALLRDRSLDSVLAELRAELPRFVRPKLKVRDLMSYSVRTVKPETLIKDVAERMLRTGHEGFPVVSVEGRVVGLVTRNAVDRALQHRWQHEPVSRIMAAGEVSVSPVDSVEHVRSLMIQKGWGQVPVVDAGWVSGVVTRTDLIRLPPSERESERQQHASLMKQAFPAPLLTLIRRIGEEAAERSDRLYFVGGIVRDLLLGRPVVDVDLVVEGNAIHLCRGLTRAYGGEVRTHSRFGTAKWLLTPQVWQRVLPDITAAELAELPSSIDFVTARTEFYTRPTALPQVAWSSIKQDLHRRDFTINTLAIRLSPGHWGELLDFYDGQADLRNGVIRVLHSLSFVDDPTRILRAARFEARLDFHLDPRSEALIADALPLLDRVTGGRLRHEMAQIFHEARPEAALARLQTLGALPQLDPALVADAGIAQRFQQLRAELDATFWRLDEEDLLTLYWALFLYGLESSVLRRIAKRLIMPSALSEPLFQLPDLQRQLMQLDYLEQPAEIVALLESLTSPLLAAAWLLAREECAREKIVHYWQEWRHIRPLCTGDDLRAWGLPPGPSYRRILDALRTARLNGEISTRAEEEALVRELAGLVVLSTH
ncbi:MAG: CBS domain-containing protein [Chloroflexota bacterium]|nr:CBS domain-containing protein [Chloroflexota bacterium]